MDRNYYIYNGKYTKSCPQAFLKRFDKYKNKSHISKTVKEIISDVRAHFDYKGYVLTTHNIRLSRFLPVRDILRKKLRTCGSIAAVTAVALRYLGYPTKLIHGKLKYKSKIITHAWIETYLPSKKKFVYFDPFRPSNKVTDNHLRIAAYRDWSDMEKKYAKK